MQRFYPTLRGGIATAIVVAMPLVGVACGGGDGDRDEAEATAKSFAEAYFNYDFDKAAPLVTDDSQRWLRFAASNVYEADLDTLRAMDTGVTVDVVDIDMDDSTAVATIRVSGHMLRDTIGKAGHVVGEAEYKLSLGRDGKKWKVRMAAPLRNEK